MIKYNAWKNQLTMVINFKSSMDTDAKHLMHSKKDNRDIIICKETDETIN